MVAMIMTRDDVGGSSLATRGVLKGAQLRGG